MFVSVAMILGTFSNYWQTKTFLRRKVTSLSFWGYISQLYMMLK